MHFFYIVIAAFLIAVPVSYMAMNRWLQDYNERISLSAYLFLLPLLFISGITLITVFNLCKKAAERNPAVTLKS